MDGRGTSAVGWGRWLGSRRAPATFLLAALIAATVLVGQPPLRAHASSGPVVYAVDPNRGTTQGGTAVTIYGAGFTGATGVEFGSVTATCGGGSGFFVISDTQIFASSPPNSAGTVDVIVVGPGGSSPTGPADKFTYTNPAVAIVSGISPNSGTTGGGTEVIIHGSGFATATEVTFGAARVAAFPSSDTTLFVSSPAGTAGTVDLIVINPAGLSATTNADKFTYVAPGGPVVQALSPNHGTSAGGDRVVIVGTGFTNATAVHFGATAVASGGFGVVDDSHLVVDAAPPGAAATTVDVTVTTPAGTSAGSNGDRFSYIAATVPVINGVIENSGPTIGGTFVELIGSGFTGVTSVMFGTHAGAGVSASNDTDLFVTSPAAPQGTVNITVITPVGTSSINAADKFTYQTLSAPVIYGISPHTGITSGNTQVTIYGSGLVSGSTVRFGSTAATTVQAFDTSLFVQSPAGSAGTIDITITNPAGTSVPGNTDKFTYVAPGAPLVQAVSPNRGFASGGDSIYLQGTGFTGATSVQFGAAASTTISVFNDTQLYVLSPAGTSGTTVDITVTTPVGTSATSGADRFTYFTPVAPTITAVSPSTGPASGGTPVWITGTGFSAVSAVNFGTSSAFGVQTQSDTVIQIAGSPSGTAGSTVDVTVVTPGGTSAVTTADKFNYTAAVAPVVHAVSPSSGPANGNTTVYITGTGFSGVSAVNFGAIASSNFFAQSDGTVITATSPAGTNAAIADIRIVTPGGTSAITTNDQFTYTPAVTPPAPTISAVSPSTGPATGGTAVYVSGNNLTGATQVSFGGVAAASFNLTDDNLLQAISPSGPPGTTVDITVTTPSGTSATGSADRFGYSTIPVPVITGVSPTTGPLAGGTTVYITGSGFNGLTSVSFGTNAAGGFALSDTLAQATSLTGTGTVDITITTGGGTSATSANDSFVYGGPAPSGLQVNGVTDNTGSTAGGSGVQIFGLGFTGATTVSFGTIPAQPFTVADDTTIYTSSPAGSAGRVDVTVTAGGSTSATSSADSFTYLAPGRPVVDALEPSRGSQAGGTSVAITGSNFTGATAVHFGSVAATSFFTFGGDLQIFATSPRGVGTVDVTVTTPSGTSAVSPADAFTYVVPGPPVVNAVDPASGSSFGQTSVVLFGSGFSGTTAVAFGTTPAFSFSPASDSELFVTSPPGTAGTTVNITVTTPIGTSPMSNTDKFTYLVPPVPAVNAVSPGRGGTNGGNTISLFGSGFSGVTAVHFGTTLVGAIFNISDGMLDVTSPAGVPGTVDITVTAPGGVSAINAGDKFTYYSAPAPTVTAVSPGSGPPGTLVYLTGTGLGDATAVLFGTACVAFFGFNITDTSLPVNAPPGPVGTVDVRVVTPEGISAVTVSDQFTYSAPTVPSVTAVGPASGPSAGGTLVFITGTGLAAVTSVSFGSTPISGVFAIDDGLIEVTSPAGASGSTVDIQVTTPGGTSAATSADRFTWAPTPTPTVSAVRPSSGPSGGGSDVLVTGSGFLNASQMHFGSTQLNPCNPFGLVASRPASGAAVVKQPSRIPSIRVPVVTKLPVHKTAPGTVRTATTPTFATVLSPSAPILLKTAVKPASPAALSTTNAPNASSFCLSSFQVLSDTLIDLNSPAQGTNTGTVDITVASPGGTSATSTADQYTYTATPAPVVSAVSPSSGRSAGGSTVYISGSNLTNPSAVKFGTSPATIVTTPFSFCCFLNLNSDSFIEVTSPAGTNPSTVDVTVTTAGGTSATSSADHYTYGPTPAPTVGVVSPSSGPVGSTVFITGTGFSGATAVNFGTTPAIQGFSVISDTLIQATSPSHGLGPVDITVVTGGVTSATSTNDRFTYMASPTPVVTSVGPNTGPPGTTVYINGTGLTGASAVSFGAANPAGFAILSDSLIVAASPSGTGTVNVTVTTPGGTSATSSNDLWTFQVGLPGPTVTSVAPNSGPAAGGTSVTITGTNLTLATAVKFGTVAASYSVTDATHIAATSPAGSGTVDVTVTTQSGTSAITAGDKFTYSTPQAPTGVRAVAGDGEATLTFTPPSAGTPITGYTVVASPGGATTTVSPVVPAATITGLTNGTAYTFTVAATNAVGTGPASPATPAVTPAAVVQGPSVAVLPAMSDGAYGGYLTAAYLENVSTSAAHIRVQYFDVTGHGVGNGNSVAGLPAGATWTLRTDNGDSLAATQPGSAVVYSDQPLAVFVNEFAPGNSSDATSYTAIKVPAGTGNTLFAPAIANNAYGGYTTGIGLVSLATVPTNITVTYRDATGATIATQTLPNVPAGAYQGLYSGAGNLPNGFAGTATITSSAGPLAAVVNETGPGSQFSSYDAVPAGSSALFAPVALRNAFGGYNTGMGIQNTTGTAGTVTITYYDSTGTPTVRTFPIVANGYVGVYQGTNIPADGAYTAKITSTVAIAAIVNEVAASSNPNVQQSTAYNTFAAGSSSLHLPLVESAGADGWSTGEGIMNTGSAATTVTVTYYDPVTGAQVGTPQSLSLPPNAFWGLYQPAGGLPTGTRASAVVTTASGGQVAVICNESNATSFMSYTGQ